VFLLGADRVVPPAGRSHLYALLEESARAGETLTQDYYEEYTRLRRTLLEALLAANPNVAPPLVLTATQRLLDRVLFIAFAEDRDLLPGATLQKAYEHRDPYRPRAIWDNFRALFHAIDQGSQPLDVPRYNGGLFALDSLLDERLEAAAQITPQDLAAAQRADSQFATCLYVYDSEEKLRECLVLRNGWKAQDAERSIAV
jgi:hypothetical protein